MSAPGLRKPGTPRRARLLLVVFVLAAASWWGGGSLAAQDGGLDGVEELIVAGRTAEARDALEAWWESRREAAEGEEWQQALWLRARLTVDPSLARIDYTRLVLEHPGGPYSAGALLRLGQAAAAEGRPSEAARLFDQLLRDYPESPHRLEARRWLDRHGGSVPEGAVAGGDQGADARAGEDGGARDGDGARAGTETDGDAEASEPASTRAATGGEPPADTARERGGTDPEPGVAGRFSVQLGAFSTGERARTFLRRARERGVEDLRLARVRGSDLVRVRAGHFDRPDDAAALRERLRGLGLETAIVENADEEEVLP